jgi:hypothetical protein
VKEGSDVKEGEGRKEVKAESEERKDVKKGRLGEGRR